MKSQNKYSTVVIDAGSGLIKAGFGGEDGPRSIFNSIVGTPKQMELMVGMELQNRYVGDNAIARYEIMNFSYPIQRGEVTDWDKYENLMHYLLYSEMRVVPEEISILITEGPRTSRKNREKLTEILFETFNVKRLHIANSSMVGLYSYGKTSGLIVDSGYNVTSTVPVYEGYPLAHASLKINIGSAFAREESVSMDVRGRNLITGLPKTINVNSEEMLSALSEPVASIVEAVCCVLEKTPPELSSDISDRGIVMTGGGSLLYGLDKLICQKTGIETVIAEDAISCVAIGTGKYIEFMSGKKMRS